MNPQQSNALDLSKIWVRRQNRNKNAGERRDIVAMDTETQDGMSMCQEITIANIHVQKLADSCINND